MIIEQRLHDGLAIIKGAFDGDVVDVGGCHRRHLAALHIRDEAVGVQDEDRGVLIVLEGLDGGTTGVARGGTDNRGS